MRPAEVIAHFADDPRRAYQLYQWLPVLEQLDRHHPVAIVTRNAETTAGVTRRTHLPALLAHSFNDLVELYDQIDPKVAVYVNNSVHNFHSLINRRMFHVHVNHGESDKVCMVSNQAKAYDRVFVAGEAAVQRHRAGLMELDESKLVRVGRPQLDLRPPALLPPSPRRTVLYAPTWEGEADYNNYTSVDAFGPAIVAAALEVPYVRVAYKPHPRVTTSITPSIEAGHNRILALLETANRLDPEAGHRAQTQGDILAVFPGCDVMITDVSSVGLDFLYLHTDKPLLITDRYDDGERLRTEVPVSRCADVIDSATLPDLAQLLTDRLNHDEHRVAREAMRRHYFGDLRVGESTERFLDAIDELIALRDRLIGSQAPPEGEFRVASI